MKLIRNLVVLGLILGGGLFASTVVTKNSTNEFTVILDQLYPLVKEGHVYVKTQEPDEVNGYGTATCIQIAADANGETRKIAFNGLSELKVDRYLRLTNKGAHVETYEEVSKEDVPAKALAEIDQ